MIFLLNHERVYGEILELAKLVISGILEIDPGKVKAELTVEDGKIQPKFEVNVETAGALEQGYIQQAMKDAWLGTAKPELISRLKGMHEVRYGFEKEKTAAKEKEA